MTDPPPRPALKGAAKAPTGAAELMKTAVEAFERRATIRVGIYQTLVNCLVDTCRQWDKSDQASASDKAVAREVEEECGKILSYLAVNEAAGDIVARLSGPGPANAPRTQQQPAPTATWAGVAAAGAARKPATATNPKTPLRTAKNNTIRSYMEVVAERRARAEEDERVLLTVRDGGNKKAPVDVRVTLAGILGLTISDIPAVTLTRTGYAARFTSTENRVRLLDPSVLPELGQRLDVIAARMNEQWVNYVVPGVPSAIRDYTGALMPLSVAMVAEEVALQAGVVPREVKQSRHGANAQTGLCTWIVSFLVPVTKPWNIFQSRNAVLIRRDRDPIELHNPGCQGYCKARRCTRLPRCNNCAGDMATHTPGPCTAVTKCANCRGPHQAGAEDCFALPGVKDGKRIPLTRAQMKRAKQKGQRAWEAANAPDGENPMDADTEATMHGAIVEETNKEGPSNKETAQSRKRGASPSSASSQPEITVRTGKSPQQAPPSRTQRATATPVNYNVLAMADKAFNPGAEEDDDQAML